MPARTIRRWVYFPAASSSGFLNIRLAIARSMRVTLRRPIDQSLPQICLFKRHNIQGKGGELTKPRCTDLLVPAVE